MPEACRCETAEWMPTIGTPVAGLLHDQESIWYGQGLDLVQRYENGRERRISLAEHIIGRGSTYRKQPRCPTNLHGMAVMGDDSIVVWAGYILIFLQDSVVKSKLDCTNWIVTVHAIENDDTIFVGLAHGQVQHWQQVNDEWNCIQQYTIATSTLLCMAVRHDGIVAGGGSTLWVYDGAFTHFLEGHKGMIHDIAWNGNNQLASVADDRTVRVWRRRRQKDNDTWTTAWIGYGHASRVWTVTWYQNWIVVTGGQDGTVLMWNETGTCIDAWRHGVQIRRLCATNNGVWAGRQDGQVLYKSMESVTDRSIETIRLPPEHAAVVVYMCWSENHESWMLLTKQGQILLAANSNVSTQVRLPNLGMYTCLQVSSSGLTCVGTKTGTLVTVVDGQVDQTLGAGCRFRSLQKLEWIESHLLCAYHIQGLMMWREGTDGRLHEHRRILATTQGMILCLAMQQDQILCGDSRGCVSLLDEKDLVDVRHGMHGREHVTALAWWTGKDRFVSVGHDCHLVHGRVLNGRIELLLSFPLLDYTGLTHVWPCGNCVGGYMGNEFSVWYIRDRVEVWRVDTHDRQNLLRLHSSSSSEHLQLAVVHGNELRIHKIPIHLRASKESTPDTMATHGLTIFDVALFPLADGKMGLVTASEDCTCCLSIIDGSTKSLLSSQRLPRFVNGARAVDTASLGEDSTLVCVGGGANELHFYQLKGADCIRHLCKGRPTSDGTEHRINAVAAMESGIVLVGDSSGRIVAYNTKDHERFKYIPGMVLRELVRAILCMKVVDHENQILVFIGTSDGRVIVFGLTDDLTLAECAEYQAHSIGTIDLSTLVTDSKMQVVSAGDDQQLVTAVLDLNSHIVSVEHAAFGGSALRGVVHVGDTVYTTSFDQGLYRGSTLEEVGFVDVGDVNGMSACHDWIVVCGHGLYFYQADAYARSGSLGNSVEAR